MALSPRQLPPGEFSWLTAFWKAFRDTGLLALMGGLSLLFSVYADLLTPEKLAELGVPSYYALLLVAVFRFLQNIGRVRFGLPIAIACMALLGAAPQASAGEALRKTLIEPLISPHLVGFAGYNANAPEGESKFSLGITANVLGPRLGDWPCNIAGFGIGLETIAPGLENVSFARASVPILTCSPFGGRVALQVGALQTIGGVTAGDKTLYGGVGVDLTSSVEQRDIARAARIKAKEKKALLDLQDAAQGRGVASNLIGHCTNVGTDYETCIVAP